MSVPDLSPAGLPPAFPDRAAWGTAGALRAWQTAALEQYFADERNRRLVEKLRATGGWLGVVWVGRGITVMLTRPVVALSLAPIG